MEASEFFVSQNLTIMDVQSMILNLQGKLCSKPSISRRHKSIHCRKIFIRNKTFKCCAARNVSLIW